MDSDNIIITKMSSNNNGDYILPNGIQRHITS